MNDISNFDRTGVCQVVNICESKQHLNGVMATVRPVCASESKRALDTPRGAQQYIDLYDSILTYGQYITTCLHIGQRSRNMKQ